MSVVVILLGINMSNFKIQVGWNKGGVGSTFISTLLSQHGVNCIESKDPLLTADLLLIPCNLDHLWAPEYGSGQFKNQLTEFVLNCNAKHICFIPNKISRLNQWVEFESRLDVLMLNVGRSFNVSPPIYEKGKFSHWLNEGAQEPLIDPITDMFTSYILKLIQELGGVFENTHWMSWSKTEDGMKGEPTKVQTEIKAIAVEKTAKAFEEWLSTNLKQAGHSDFNINDFLNLLTWDDYRIYVGGARIADFEAETATLNDVKQGYLELVKMFGEAANFAMQI